MKIIHFLRSLSIIAYLLIILTGQIIGIPFICWLLFTMFDIGNIDQVFAIFGVLGVILNFTKWKYKNSTAILSFVLMLSPLIRRMAQVPVKLFNYAAFEIPFFLFITGYTAFMILNARNNKLQA